MSKRITLLTAGDKHCRWPLGEPTAQMQVCGKRRKSGQPYCREHMDLAHDKASTKRSHDKVAS